MCLASLGGLAWTPCTSLALNWTVEGRLSSDVSPCAPCTTRLGRGRAVAVSPELAHPQPAPRPPGTLRPSSAPPARSRTLLDELGLRNLTPPWSLRLPPASFPLGFSDSFSLHLGDHKVDGVGRSAADEVGKLILEVRDTVWDTNVAWLHVFPQSENPAGLLPSLCLKQYLVFIED